ncbi:methyltransferase domain-containing protein [Auritidibacter ignavus]|uniref:methyltransferase domain-containing protein n=2 Tax=Auritidibacter ignavus TaxID=678932 RepID=UPI003211D1E9
MTPVINRCMTLFKIEDMRCDYFDKGLCRSCTWMNIPYTVQLSEKVSTVRSYLDPILASRDSNLDDFWTAPVCSPEEGFRNKAKMVVTGSAHEPNLGILDPDQHPKHHDGTGVDLSECPLYEPAIIASFEPIRRLIIAAGIEPYQMPTRRGELKHVIITVSPQQQLMIRFVLRSTDQLAPLREHLPALQDELARRQAPARVITANILPQHQALLEGDEEIHLAGDQTLTMLLNGVPLRLRPQGFFQTNTVIAAELYHRAATWIAELPEIRVVWDLYAGVGGFGLTLADTARRAGTPLRVWGMESSPQAITAGNQTVADLGLADTVQFRAGDATRLATAEERPDLVVVNPPRRGIGAELASWLNTHTDHVLYSSCHPKTLAADLEYLPDFTPVRGTVLDMFPQTAHCETLVLLSRCG